MNIAQCTDTFLPIVDGVGRVAHNYAVSLAKKGEHSYVIAPMSDAGYRGGMPFELIEFFSLSVPTQRQYSSGLPLLDPHYDARISKTPLDVLHAHSPFIAGQEALRLARRRNIPLVGTFHSRYYDDFYKLTRAEMLANMAVRSIVNFYERCDEVWTVSQSAAETLHDYGYGGDIVVMPNGTPDVKPDRERMRRAKADFSLPDGPLLLYCGQINWKKNLLRTLEAAALYANSGAPFTLVLAGQGPDRAAIAEKAQELGLGDRLRFTGHITNETDLYGLYQLADLFVFPSLYDTSGMVVREAAAMATPSVVVSGSAAAEPIRDGENGYLCADDSADLCRVSERALSDPAQLKAAGRAARKSIYLPWDVIVERALERYRALSGKL